MRFRQQFEDEFASCTAEALSGASKAEFFSALALTLSRAFSHFAASAELAPSGAHPIVMLPLADMQNHDETHNTGWQVREGESFVLFCCMSCLDDHSMPVFTSSPHSQRTVCK